jgi:hypothetical protein
LNLEGSRVVTSPLFFALVGPEVVDLSDSSNQLLCLSRQFHYQYN